jgi:hypothetical protein
VSSKKTCPACDSHTSALYTAFENGWPCEYCGLSHDAWSEILTIRAARNDDDLAERFTELRVENDKLKRELAEMHLKFNRLKQSVEGALR